MSLKYPDLGTLNTDHVQSSLDFLAQRLAEYAPTLESRRGVLRDIVLHLESVFATAVASVIEGQIDLYGSLLKVTASPKTADDDLVERLLSNFRITRKAGKKATGTVAIILSQLSPVTIPSGTKFAAGSKLFTVNSSYAARTSSSSVISSTDRLISSTDDSNFIFTIEVTADEAGSSGQLTGGTSLTPQSSIPYLVSSYVESDFTGGRDEQTNTVLLDVLARGLADRSPSNRITFEGLLAGSDDFSDFLRLSAVGYGDQEQRRHHSILPIAFGGRVDLYVRTQALPQVLKLNKTATLIDKDSSSSISSNSSESIGGTWQFSIARNDAPGFYEIVRVVPDGSSAKTGFDVTEVIRGFDLTDDDTFIPDVDDAEEAAFSRFETATVRFLDDDTDATDLVVNSSTKDYDVYVRVMPQIKTLQTFIGEHKRRPAADVLVKAPVPCFLTLSFEITKKSSENSPDLDDIKDALADYVNATDFGVELHGSSLAHAVHKHLSSTQAMRSLLMTGRLVRPDGTEESFSDAEVLEVTKDLPGMVSEKTVSFFLEEDNITITVVSI